MAIVQDPLFGGVFACTRDGQHNCTYYDVLALEDQRLASMRELPEALRRALAT